MAFAVVKNAKQENYYRGKLNLKVKGHEMQNNIGNTESSSHQKNSMSSSDFRLIVGLGNPGNKYIQTRHNVGFMALKRLASSESASFGPNKKLYGELAEIGFDNDKTRLLMPNTFMNDSGRSIRSAMDWFDLKIDQILIIVDDIDLPLGRLRFRSNGSSGGHNGLKSIIDHLGSKEFCRLRIGIGRPKDVRSDNKSKTISHVLGNFTTDESKIINEVINEVLEGLDLMKKFSLEKGANHINSYKSMTES